MIENLPPAVRHRWIGVVEVIDDTRRLIFRALAPFGL